MFDNQYFICYFESGDNMQIKIVPVGTLQANCYIVTVNDKSIIIDPGDEAEKIINASKDKNVVGILVTHHHYDHVGALEEIKKHFNLDYNNDIKEINYEVINTPGHSSDSLTYYFPDYKIMFTGDFIFKGTIGRMDLPTGSAEDMMNSLDNISKYPLECIVYPGHGMETTLKEEIERYKVFGI